MDTLDLVVRNGTVVSASDTMTCDVGVRDGRIVALARDLPRAKREIDARERLVLPGGIDSHCHIEQQSSFGVMCADDFHSGTVSAVFGGTTTIIPFAAQHRGQSLREVVEDYHARAAPKAVVDYAFHLIISDPTEQVLGQELPALIRDGYTSFKVYMTYDLLRLDDFQMLDVLDVARREQAMVMVHAENHDVIRWFSRRLLDRGHRLPRYHAVSHPRIAEGEATSRAIDLASLLDVPLLIVHVSAGEAIDAIRDARGRGLKIYGETCPQYLFLTAKDLDREGMEGAMYCCSPPPRDEAAQQAVWRGLEDGTFEVFSSDHAPYRFDASGKLAKGPNAAFKDIANGVPGIELPPAPALLGRRGNGTHRPQPLRRPDRDQRGEALRALPAQGKSRRRGGRGHRDLEPGTGGEDQRGPAARQRRLHPLRGARRPRLAGDGAEPRAGGCRGRRPRGRAGQRRVPALRDFGAGAAPRAHRARARPRAQLERRPPRLRCPECRDRHPVRGTRRFVDTGADGPPLPAAAGTRLANTSRTRRSRRGRRAGRNRRSRRSGPGWRPPRGREGNGGFGRMRGRLPSFP